MRGGEKEWVGKKMRTGRRETVCCEKNTEVIKKDREGRGMKGDGHVEVGRGEKDEEGMKEGKKSGKSCRGARRKRGQQVSGHQS